MRILFLILCCFLVSSCHDSASVPELESAQQSADLGDSFDDALPEIGGGVPVLQDILVDASNDGIFLEVIVEQLIEEIVEEANESYPPGPYALEKFGIVPDMSFYDPWNDNWISLSDYYKHPEVKALIVVSSAGWCGPCLMEAAALIGLYEKYAPDGLEIVYTMGNTNVPGDVPFDTTIGKVCTAGFAADLDFMDNWKLATATEAGKLVNYPMYADPNRDILAEFPNHNWPLSFMVTTKDMGVRLVEEGYWSALMENKLMLCLYGDPPNLPLEW